MSSGSNDSTLINMPDYGDGLDEALKAQIGALSGELLSGPLKGTTLQEVMERYERPLRMSAAQIDNDVLRQTLLGGQVPVYKSTSGMNIVERRASQPGEGGQTTLIDYGGAVDADTGKVITRDAEIPEAIRDWSTLVNIPKETLGDKKKFHEGFEVEYNDKLINYFDKHKDYWKENGPIVIDGKTYSADGETGKSLDTLRSYMLFKSLFVHPSEYVDQWDDEFSEKYGTPKPIYKKNNDISDADSAYEQYKKDGGDLSREEWGKKDFIVPKDEDGNFILEATNETEIPAGGFASPDGQLTGYTRAGTGLVDMMGDNRMAIDPATGLPTSRKAGFDEDGNFLGLAALAEDIQRGNLSRQREADLADVERLDDRYKNVMDQFRPGTQQALTDASAVLQAQKDNLTGAGALTVPGDSTYGGDLGAVTMTAAQVGAAPSLTAGTSYNAAQVADPMALTAATSYDPSASVTGDGYTATANLEGGNIGADSLRAALLADAETALSQGLTEREQAKISNAARARSTMMGRTFDQSGAIAEAQALVGEDNNRRMQNRGFAQSALGQEADIQRSDLDRGLQASMRNQDALNRAAEFGASQNMQAQLANQAATNQALSQGLTAGLSQEALAAQQQQAKAMADATAANRASEFGVSAGLQQDALRAQLGQQTNMAQAQFDQQANAFGADAQQRANQVNQAQQQQANQFGVGATMDAQRLNEQLKQSGTLGYIDASTRLAALEDQYSLDPFQALLQRPGGGSLQAGSQVFGQAGYGLSSGPNYLNPESGLGYISQMAANNANMYAANQAANASRNAGMYGMFGNIIGGVAKGVGAGIGCWVAREVYGETNPSWMLFREWLIDDSPSWFRNLYIKYGERFANWISDKPRIKSIIRKWMDSKIGGK